MKICPYCNTENKDEFIFCKNCGAELSRTYTENTGARYTEPAYSAKAGTQFTDVSFGGVTYAEMQTFVGPKHQSKFMNSFVKSEITGSKVSFCWPVAILTYFLGFIGAGIWFLYRKMYKEGFLFSAIGVVMNTLVALLCRGTDFNFETLTENMLSLTLAPNIALPSLAVFLSGTAGTAAAVLFGLFAINMYKKHAVKKITAFKALNADHPYYMFGISSIGGTSIGMALLGVVFYFIPNLLIDLASIITGILL